MAKDSFYFSHDYNARNDEKTLELRLLHGAEGYGLFWMLIETMCENDNGGVKATLIGGLSLGYGVAKSKLMEVISTCVTVGLLYEEEGYYYSKRLLKHKEYRKNLVEWGVKGANNRWGSHRGANGKGKESKGKEIKGVSFDEENANVILSDGTKQELGVFQKIRLRENDLIPSQIIKGLIT